MRRMVMDGPSPQRTNHLMAIQGQVIQHTKKGEKVQPNHNRFMEAFGTAEEA